MSKISRILRRITSNGSEDSASLMSDAETLDEAHWHTRQLDPADADIYLDALWGPLYFKYERVRQEGDPIPRWSDYRMVGLFLILNLALQLGIAFKIYQLSESGDLETALFDSACWRVSSRPGLLGVLYPQSMADSSEFDCLDPILTLSMIPSKLDLDQNGYWSIDEAASLGRALKDKGSQMTNFSAVLIRMAKYDFKNRIGSKSAFKQMQHVDMDFFKHFRGNIEMCLPIDPNLCGNLEARGRLSGILPEMDAEERVQACRDNFDSFCKRLYGEDYEWIHHASSQYCGESTLERKDSVNVVTYDAVSIYKGQPDSIVGTTFMSFLVLLLFIWGMLLIEEFRAIYNLMYVIWYVPSIEDSNATFASIDDGKLFVRRLPKVHKFFAIFCIGLPRLVIAGVILVVGAFFLTATNNLQDLVLNSTALCFLIEVDNMIHAAFLGEAFQKRVTDNCDVIQVETSARGAWQSYVFLAVVLATTAGWTAWSYFHPRGLLAIGMGVECLCKAKKERQELAAARRKAEKDMQAAQSLRDTEEKKDEAIQAAKAIADKEMENVQAREARLSKDEKKYLAEKQEADHELAQAEKDSNAAEKEAREANDAVVKAERLKDDARHTKSSAESEMNRAQHLMGIARKMHKEELEAMAAVRQMEAEAKHDLEVAFNEKDTAKKEASTVHHASSEIEALEEKKRRQIAEAKREAASAEQIAASAAAEKRHADQEVASVAGMLKEGKTAEERGQKLLRQASAKEAKLTAAQQAVAEAQQKAASTLQSAQEEKEKAAAEQAEQEEAIKEAKAAKEEAEADAASMESRSDLKENRYLKYGLALATLVAWGSVVGLLYSRYKHQELHDHHLNMIVRLNSDKMEWQEALNEALGRQSMHGDESGRLQEPLLNTECQEEALPPSPNKGG